jgi:alkylation response protein AidB-like acyl-CoA dehydrogenase
MQLELSLQESQFRDEVRAFLATALTEDLRHAVRNTAGHFMSESVYHRWHSLLNAKGWLAYQWPAEFGGPGWSHVQRYIFERECALARAPQIAIQGVRLVAPVIYTFGSAAQKTFFLPKILSGEHFWCQGYSEPEAGSDLASLRMRAVRDGDHYVLNGTKIWTTNAHFSNWIFCLVRTDPSVKPQLGISFLLIDLASPGVEVRPILSMSGDHELNQVFFADVRVPISNRVGEEGQGWTLAKFLLENERGGTCFAPGLLADLGNLRTAAEGNPAWLHDIAKLEIQAQALEMLELRLLAELSQGRPPGPQSSLISLATSRIRKGTERLTIELHGYDALQLERRRPLYRKDLPAPVGSESARMAMPTYLNGLAWSIMGGTDEVMRTIVAKQALGM